MKLFGEFTKVERRDDGSITVAGIISSEAVDSQGEIVLASAMREAIGPYFAGGPAVREQHDPLRAVGAGISAEVDAEGRTHFECLVVDPLTIAKITSVPPVLRGFSIGGTVPPGGRDPANSKRIRRVVIQEVSAVDKPSCPDALVTMWKADAGEVSPNWPNGERTEATVQVDAPSAPATVEEPAHRCPVCQSGLACPKCTAGADTEKVAKLAGHLAADSIAKAHRERDEAVAKVVHLEGERDDLVKALADAREQIARNPKGAVRVMPRAVSKGDDTADYQAAESVAPGDALSAIRKAHQRPVALRVKAE